MSDCPKCGGTGEVIRSYSGYDGLEYESGDYSTCPKCGGSGKIDKLPEIRSKNLYITRWELENDIEEEDGE